MNHTGLQAYVHRFRLKYFPAISTPSYNLSSIVSFIPGSQFLTKGNEPTVPLNVPEVSTTSLMAKAWPTAEVSKLAAEKVTEKVYEYQQIPSFPSPWEFFTSGYIVGLMIMATLLHRIQNVVIPSSRRARHAYRNPLHQTTPWERFLAIILPLDFSRTSTRLVFHLPSLYFLSRMLIIWILLILQTCEVSLSFWGDQNGIYAGHLDKLTKWVMHKEMTEICWSSFCTVCGASLLEGLIKALDRLGGGGLPPGAVNNLSPFHLVSYAFLLHVYSSPVSHGFHPADDSPSRPDKHVVITITIALLQLSMFHILSISKRLSTHRLIPTALSSMLSLTHFHATIFSHILKPPNPRVVSPTTNLSGTRTLRRSNTYLGPGATYPLLNYVPNLFETTLLATILLTVTVNAIAQLLVRGRVDHVLDGLGFFNGLPNDDGTQNGFFANLPYDEDFLIVLLRIGVASLEATGLRGWNNEVVPIRRPRIRPHRMLSSRKGFESGHSTEDTYGRVRMGRLSVSQVLYGTTSVRRNTVALRKEKGYKDRIPPSGRSRSAWRPQHYVSKLRRGFNNDVRIIDLGHADTSGLFSGPWNRSVVALWQFLVVFWGVIRGLVFWLLDKARTRAGDSRRERKSRPAIPEEDEEDAKSDGDDSTETDSEVYQRFLRGEDISDDDDDAMEGSSTKSDEEMSDEMDEEKYSQEGEVEMVDLFADLLRSPDGRDSRIVPNPELNGPNSGSNGEMALAHLLHGSSATSRPLTRQLWNSLTHRGYYSSSRTDSDDDLSFGDQQAVELVSERYSRGAEQRDKEKGLQHICVICMLETREIICWPCRCLAMCDACRETLSLRTPTSKHRCPCCRQLVDGYSKIYIP